MASQPGDAGKAARQVASGFAALFKWPDLSDPSTGSGLNETFALLLRVIILFGVMLAVWAAGAGAMRAEWLITPCDPLRACAAGVQCCPALAQPPLGFAGHVGLVLVEVARGIGGVEALCLSAGLVGAILGFLFGLPQTAPAGTPTNGTATTGASGGKWQTSTNLSQISDWLTKIIVGVSLVTFGATWAQFIIVVNTSAGWLFESRHGSPAVIGAALLGGFVLGFMFCYLYTDLIIAKLIAETDKTLNAVMEAVRQMIASIGADNEVLAPRISRLQQDGALPTVEQATGAMQLSDIDLKALAARRDVKMWARARAVLNLFGAAADGYAKLLGMPDDTQVPTDAGLLIEAARVFFAARRKSEAVVFAELSLAKLRDDAELLKNTELKQAIVGDAIVLRLGGWVPGGYKAALDLIQTFLVDKAKAAAKAPGTASADDLPDDAIGRLHVLRALANAQRYAKDTTLTDPVAKEQVRVQVMQDLKFVVDLGKYSKDTLREFWRPATPAEQASPERHDDLAVFGANDPNLKSMLGTQPS